MNEPTTRQYLLAMATGALAAITAIVVITTYLP